MHAAYYKLYFRLETDYKEEQKWVVLVAEAAAVTAVAIIVVYGSFSYYAAVAMASGAMMAVEIMTVAQ